MSITDRCNLRCVYCTYWQDWEEAGQPRKSCGYEELLRLAGVGVRAGHHARSGSPAVSPWCAGDWWISSRDLHQVPGIEEVCLTTNGVLLPELAPALYDAGLRHLNVSLDTLRRDRYRQITGRDNLAGSHGGP